MHVNQLHPWPTSVPEAEAIQERLRLHVELTGPTDFTTVAGLDVHYHGVDALSAAVVVLDAGTLAVVEQVVVHGKAAFPYRPGLFAFRELPALVEALERLTVTPDLLVCDGYGLAHPRRFGLACHLGLLTGLPSLGVAKTPFVGTHTTPDRERGSWTPIVLDDTTVGRALRTQRAIKPVYVSQGHRITLDTATDQVLRLAPRFRLPDPIRAADHLARHGT
ncbi:endonuclease V [Nonomuraea sp. ZG12]|uniref:endonuclease V n=1 Tax=Nonomuraea sp. ZG12 TaxID=3452207 RepID=UPI003F8B96FC